MANSIIIKFQPKGDKELLRSLKRLNQLQQQLEGQIKATTRESGLLSTAFDRNRKSGDALGNTFSTMRSKMLLFSFAMSMGGRQLIEFGKKAAHLESMETAFNNLQGGTENATVAIEKLKIATSGTMSNFDLFQQANNAMVLGITKNSDEMAEMFKMAQRLGRALGVNTKRSVESLITGIGRQSRMMLDNIGIVVDTEKAYKDYAEKLGTSAAKLTEVEKKQAFLNATLDASREKVLKLGPDIEATIDSYDRLASSWSNYTDRLGKDVNRIFGPLNNAFSYLLDNSGNLETRLIDGMGALLPPLKISSKLLNTASTDFEKVATKVGEIDYSRLTFDLMDDDVFGQFLEFAPQVEESVDAITEKIEKMTPEMKQAAGQINSLASAITDYALSSQSGSRTIKEFGNVVISTMERIVSTFLANYATFKLMSFFFPGFASLATMPSLFGFTPKHNGGKIEEYHTGGMIPEYHSGGDVPIMAQEGEFVMRRSAVESIGLENMNRMNRTGQASGGANITFTGNIMSDSFIEEEAIPKIKDAIRRGADIGIS